MDGDDNWDLYAVVRGRRPSATRDPLSSFSAPPELPETLCAVEGATEFFNPFIDSDTSHLKVRSPSYLPGSQQYQQLVQSTQLNSLFPPSAVGTGVSELNQQQAVLPQPTQRAAPTGQISRSKRRKNQQKKVVCRVSPEGLSSDVWAWRKYGQKPIKGSPYPRGYYRCSSSKSCLARKQVERCRTDPKTFVVTYTAEHNHAVPTHRNSLAGVSRTKFAPANAQTGDPSDAAGMDDEAKGEDEEELAVEDMEVAGEDEFVFVGDEEEDGELLFAAMWGENSRGAVDGGGS